MTENYLLDAVDKLTLVHTTKVPQSKTISELDDEGAAIASIDISSIAELEHEPLLLQLRDAVVGGIGSHAGSSSPRERIPFDAGALALFDEISARINAWYQQLPNHREERYIHDRLRDWYLDYSNRHRAGKVSETEDRVTTKLVEGWARSIEAMFDPTQSIEIDGACPLCGGRYAIDPKTGDRITAILVEYREIGGETLDKSTGLCRSCMGVWHGRSALREMRWAIDHPAENVTFVTVEGYTVDQLLAGIDSALEVRNMKAAASLTDLLAQAEPVTASRQRLAAKALIAKDSKRKQAS